MSEFFIYFLIFCYGACFGSFYNVLIYRLPLDMKIFNDRSMCFSCKHQLKFRDMIPIFSYIIQGGKCRYCKAPFSARYMLVELTTAILFDLAYYFSGGLNAQFFLYVVFWSMLVIVTLIDYDHMVIMDSVLIVFTAIVFLILLIFKRNILIFHIYGAVVGGFIYFLIYAVSYFIYKQEAFGLGDVFLNISLGMFLGFRDIIINSMLSFFVAIFFIGIMKLFGKKFKIKQEIPFGPYMCISAFILSIFADNIFNFYINLVFG